MDFKEVIMQFIGRNDELTKKLSNDFSLLSSKVTKINILKNDHQLFIEVWFELLYAKKVVKLSFSEIKEYSLYYKSDYDFYNVENYKFFMQDDHAYLSLDPFLEEDVIDSRDQDFIHSKIVEGFFV